jgi:outer membrane lipoprotein-sorting protein
MLRLCQTIFLLASLLGAGSVQAEELTLDQLMQMLAQTKTAKATFVETKSIAMLDAPVESSGELSYKAPGYFEKRSLKPKAESMQLDGNMLTLERNGRKRSLQLQGYPEIAAFIDSIRGTLAGDRKALERAYSLNLQGSAQDWKLLLTPTEAKMRKIVNEIEISGAHNQLHTITISQADGDSSLMTIQNLEVH